MFYLLGTFSNKIPVVAEETDSVVVAAVVFVVSASVEVRIEVSGNRIGDVLEGKKIVQQIMNVFFSRQCSK